MCQFALNSEQMTILIDSCTVFLREVIMMTKLVLVAKQRI